MNCLEMTAVCWCGDGLRDHVGGSFPAGKCNLCDCEQFRPVWLDDDSEISLNLEPALWCGVIWRHEHLPDDWPELAFRAPEATLNSLPSGCLANGRHGPCSPEAHVFRHDHASVAVFPCSSDVADAVSMWRRHAQWVAHRSLAGGDLLFCVNRFMMLTNQQRGRVAVIVSADVDETDPVLIRRDSLIRRLFEPPRN